MKPIIIFAILFAALWYASGHQINYSALESAIRQIESIPPIGWIYLAFVLVLLAIGLASRFSEKEWVEGMSNASLKKQAEWDAAGRPANAYARELVRRQHDETGGVE